MADEHARMSNYLAEDIVGNIDEVREARGEYDSLDERLDDIEGGGFTPTTEQLAAMNSGITAERLATDENNISLVADQTITYNRLKHIASSKTENNVTFTVNSDKSITVSTNGSASGNTVLVLTNYMLTADYANNKIVGVPVGTTFDSCLYVAYSNNGTSEASTSRLYDGGATSVSVSTAYTYFRLYIFIKSGITISNAITFKPMIITSEVYNAGFTEYQPYALSNVELTEKEQTNENNISINSIKSSITLAEGYSLVTQSTLYKQGKHIFGTLIIKKASGNFSTTQETVLTLPETPTGAKMCIAGFNTSEWGVVSIGYAFISANGDMAVKDSQSSNNGYCNVSIDYVTS